MAFSAVSGGFAFIELVCVNGPALLYVHLIQGGCMFGFGLITRRHGLCYCSFDPAGWCPQASIATIRFIGFSATQLCHDIVDLQSVTKRPVRA